MPLAPRVADLGPYDVLLSVAALGSMGRGAAEADDVVDGRGHFTSGGTARSGLNSRRARGSGTGPDGLMSSGATDLMTRSQFLNVSPGSP